MDTGWAFDGSNMEPAVAACKTKISDYLVATANNPDTQQLTQAELEALRDLLPNTMKSDLTKWPANTTPDNGLSVVQACFYADAIVQTIYNEVFPPPPAAPYPAM